MHTCYSAILDRIGLRYRAVEADPGTMGDSDSHEFHVLAAAGEDRLAYSPASAYAANVEKAEALAIADDAMREELAKVPTPGAKTIEDVAALLGQEHRRCVKTLIVHADADGDEPALAALVLRGDHQLNEAKAMRLERVSRPLTFATEEEIQAALGVGVGSIGPIGLRLPLFVDRSAAALASFVCGANEGRAALHRRQLAARCERQRRSLPSGRHPRRRGGRRSRRRQRATGFHARH